MSHTLEFASRCNPELKIERIEVYCDSSMEVVRTWEPGVADPWKSVVCQNHWTLIFHYGRHKATATKHRGYKLKWVDNVLTKRSVCLEFKPQYMCPSMREFVYMMGAHEYPDTLDDDCSSFV
ncbi:uncharacterized protein ATNIH1004_001680 [Aspergillus tanneri]|uniref:Uncharacterized protein n=1 Tax=Aspergillus tanneri TaxID=1220188 RepID=A0A5M9N095_9EURO|nr:uncharacterized protein ATNIH1004_001680 [Aspergillus tanneri]KAA8652775.1 hypothetical protein ATNIH1004_001680 [Aspergillus tanneri]